jgi:hypothetical protein
MDSKMLSTGTDAVGGIALAKLFPAALGIVGAVVSFMFMPPKNRKEFAARLISAGIGSHLFGDSALRVAVQLFGAYVDREELRAGVYFMTGGVFFFLIGALFLWIGNRRDKDIQEIIKDAKS